MSIFCTFFASEQFGTGMAPCMWNVSYLSVQFCVQDNFGFPQFGRKSPKFLDPVGLDKNSNWVIEIVLKGKSLSYLFIFLQVKIKIFHSHVERFYFVVSVYNKIKKMCFQYDIKDDHFTDSWSANRSELCWVSFRYGKIGKNLY